MDETKSLNQFITSDMFLSLANCILIVSGGVELLKQYVDLNPLWLNLIISSLVTATRIVFVGDFSLKGIILGFYNLIPILLGATGTYEIVKHTMN
jgi:hypothetical protein